MKALCKACWLCLALLTSMHALAQEEDLTVTTDIEAKTALTENTNNEFVAGQDVYISDSVEVWVRRGPGTQYKIIGSKTVGDKFVYLQTVNNYMQLQDKDGETFYLESKYVQNTPAGHSQITILSDKVNELEYKLANHNKDLSNELKATQTKLEKALKELEANRHAIAQKDELIAKLDEQKREYISRLETKDLDMQMRWWLQGAIIAFSGAIVGIILIYIPRPSNKKKSRNHY